MTEQTTNIWTGDDLSDTEFSAITEVLRNARSLDLGQYKDRCIRRRVAKRLRVCAVTDLEDYLERLHTDAEELDALVATISIHVSQFFRNPETFQVLEEQILPALCDEVRKAGRKTLRLWSVGCAGGEEAYSLALLLDELAPEGLEVDILGTDISAPVLEGARLGLYDPSRLREVPPPVREKYFSAEGPQFRLIERLRNRVRFERHNIMTSTDYPPADLILCRNVLIYFSRPEQERILSRFAECLSPFGGLVLGRSETLVGSIRQQFHSKFPVERIYHRAAGPQGEE